jgi:hypothetical protein
MSLTAEAIKEMLAKSRSFTPRNAAGVIYPKVAVRLPRATLRFGVLAALGDREEDAGDDQQGGSYQHEGKRVPPAHTVPF